MSFVSLSVAEHFSERHVYTYEKDKYATTTIPAKLRFKLKKEDTGIFIFNKQCQEKDYNDFMTWAPKNGYKIIYESPWCINKRYSAVEGRNKLVLFERQ